MYEVKVLKTGYAKWVGQGQQMADGTITLVKGRKNIIVDTGNPRDRDFIMDALANEGLKPEQIDFVICTHGHSDHIGNNNLFRNATFIVSYDILKDDIFSFHPFSEGVPYKIDDDVNIVPTPGHGNEDISVVVRASQGIIAIVGDLFESIEDLKDENVWKAFSKFPETQRRNRTKMLLMADYIVPGHGPMFRVDESIKGIVDNR